jgi:chloride channel 3/4/5
MYLPKDGKLTNEQLTGELEYIIPHMIGIMIAKWVADAMGRESVYDLAQSILGHPFLDADHATAIVQNLETSRLVEELVPPQETMNEITVVVPKSNKVPRRLLEEKLRLLKRRGLMDAGLVLVRGPQQDLAGRPTRSRGVLQGYLAEAELEFGLSQLRHKTSAKPFHAHDQGPATSGLDLDSSSTDSGEAQVRLLGEEPGDADVSLAALVDCTPPIISAGAPLEYAVEMFGKLGLRHLCVLEQGTGGLVGVIIKKRLVAYLERLADEDE